MMEQKNNCCLHGREVKFILVKLLTLAFSAVSHFVDGHSHDGFDHGEEPSHVFKAVPLKVISPLWSHNRGYKHKIEGMLVWSVLCLGGDLDGTLLILARKDIS